ncbi:hypothetical protein B5807_06791 [Epicoccum nigrum]|uniref:Uncharacterized protein n=1 Tax=Epicoccum nigrum TaxID=105696 RepID=A0A1Y2LZC5_EPING|nr:hypothetical protein B5807_06791 [Epicoccum nigrum]
MQKKSRNTREDTSDATYRCRDSSAVPSLSDLSIDSEEIKELTSAEASQAGITLPLHASLLNIARERVECPGWDYALLLEELGYYGLIDTAYQECMTAQQLHPFKQHNAFCHLYEWKEKGTSILADIPLAVLQALVDGSLPRKVNDPSPEDMDVFYHFDRKNLEQYYKKSDVDVSYWITRQHDNGNFVPVIYARILHDAKGRSPTPAQLLQVADYLHNYVSGNPLHDSICAEIDNQIKPGTSSEADIRNGRHKFLKGKPDRAQVIVTFATALQTVLRDVDRNVHNQPWNRNLKYIGYTDNASARSSQHDYQTSSWLMDLFTHVCRLLFEEKNKPVFQFQSYTLAYLISFSECELAEELLCRIGGGYYYGGLGFNLQNAGLSVQSSKLTSNHFLEAVCQWRALAESRYSNKEWERQGWSDYNTFDAKYQQICEEKDSRVEVEALEKEIEALEAESDELERNRTPITDLYGAVESNLEILDRLESLPNYRDALFVERIRKRIVDKAKIDTQQKHWNEDLCGHNITSVHV